MSRTIYQLVNLTAEEIYVGMTDMKLQKKYEALISDPPPSIAHWGFGADEMTCDPVDHFQDDADAVSFFKGFWHSMSHSQWKTIHCDEDCIDTGDTGPCKMDCEGVRKDKQGQ